MKGSGKPKAQVKKPMGRVAIINKLAQDMIDKGQGEYARGLIMERDMLLVNGRRPPIPDRMLNQRQKRKLIRQSGGHRKTN